MIKDNHDYGLWLCFILDLYLVLGLLFNFAALVLCIGYCLFLPIFTHYCSDLCQLHPFISLLSSHYSIFLLNFSIFIFMILIIFNNFVSLQFLVFVKFEYWVLFFYLVIILISLILYFINFESNFYYSYSNFKQILLQLLILVIFMNFQDFLAFFKMNYFYLFDHS